MSGTPPWADAAEAVLAAGLRVLEARPAAEEVAALAERGRVGSRWRGAGQAAAASR